MKRYLLTGLVILLPLALTLMIILFLFDFFTEPFVPLVAKMVLAIEHHFHFSFPQELALFISRIIALVLLCLFILLLGGIARLFLFKNIFQWGHHLLSKIPFIKTVYTSSRDIFHAIFSDEGKKAFKEPVMIPFPYPSSSALGFHSGEVAKECEEKIGEALLSVFVPTAPHPISGFLLLVPKNEVKKIAMTNEEAIKFLVSCGIIIPQPKTGHDETL